MSLRTPMTHSILDGVAVTTTHRDRDDLYRAVAQLLMQFLQPHAISLLRLVDDEQGKRVEERLHMNGSEGCLLAPSRPSGLAQSVPWQQCVLRAQVVQCERAAGGAMTVFPVHGEQEVVGLLVVESAAPLRRRATDLVRGILRIVTNHLAVLDYGERDTLTGLLNRKRFEGRFEKLRQRMISRQPGNAGHAAEPSWLALIDIDRFKSINDSHGHLFGDEVLLLVSRLLQRAFRGADQLFRFGGEEFIVILEQASESGALIALERLRAAVEEYEFPQVGRVTISIGYTRIQPQDVPALCVERADAALYYAKNHGRNNVRNSEQLVAAGEIRTQLKCGAVDLF